MDRICRPEISNYILIGDSGSGKTELALNLSLYLSRNSQKPVALFDMDQTKSLFRARDLARKMSSLGVRVADTIEYMDSPLSPPGVENALSSLNEICVLDVGGNAVGARMIGKYAEVFSESETLFLYVINPFRPFSVSTDNAVNSMETIVNAGHVSRDRMLILANPCMGPGTCLDDVLNGLEVLMRGLEENGFAVSGLAAKADLVPALKRLVSLPVFPLDLYVSSLYDGAF